MEKTVVVLGAGESGVGAAILAKQQGFEVFVSDLGVIKDEYVAELAKHNIAFEQEKHSVHKILNIAQLVIKSPGIPEKADLIVQLRAKGVEIIDEMEFAFRYKGDAKLIGITGSNGKTTTTRLTYHILQTAGYKVGLVGNVGYSFAKQIAENPCDFYVAELSSFQLDGATSLRPDVAILLNITPDHLDRYEYKLENYIASKFRIVQAKKSDDVFIYNNEDVNVAYGLQHFYNGTAENMYGVSMASLLNDEEFLHVPHTSYSIRKGDLTLKGRHNWFNTSCAVLAAKQVGVSDEAITHALTTFENEAHRLEYVITLNGVDFINDSKATNVDSVWYALDAMQKPIVWIVGGTDKGNDYTPLFDLVRQKVKAIVCMGKDNTKLREVFTPIQPILEETISVHEAIKVATLYAEAGDVVLLSPACASFDLFKNYRDRGDQFKRVLQEMHQVMTKGISVSLNFSINMNPAQNQSDDRTL